LSDLWAPLMNPRRNGRDMSFTGMRITHCWDIEPEKGAAFAKTYGCELVKSFEDMVGKVDGIISGGYYNHPWNHIIHQPYLEAGLPNLINRPLSNSLAKARKIIESAQKHGAQILVPSSYEHNDAVSRAKAWVAKRKISCYAATNAQDDYPTHGVHGLYMICRAIAEVGNPVVSVAFRARNWYTAPAVMTFEHSDRDGRHFFGTLHQLPTTAGSLEIHDSDEYGGKDFLIQMGTGYPYERTEFWATPIWVFQRMALTGEMPQTFEQILHKSQAFLAGWRSILVNDGRPVLLQEVPDDWEAPAELPNHSKDATISLFKRKFGG
jgi:predicted dehydrogenase